MFNIFKIFKRKKKDAQAEVQTPVAPPKPVQDFSVTPGDYKSLSSWYLYFRLTEYQPLLPQKCNQALSEVPDVTAARTVLAAYVATVLDIARHTIYFNYRPPLPELLERDFGLGAEHLIGLKIQDIVLASGVSERKPKDLLKRVRDMERLFEHMGLEIQNGVITGLQQKFFYQIFNPLAAPVPKTEETPAPQPTQEPAPAAKDEKPAAKPSPSSRA